MELLSKIKKLLKNEEGVSLVELIVLLFFIVVVAIVILSLTGHAELIKYVLGGVAVLVVLLIIVIAIWIKKS